MEIELEHENGEKYTKLVEYKPFGSLAEELIKDKKKDGSKATEEDRPDECILIAAKNYCVLNRKRDYFPKIKAKGVSF